MTDREKNTEAPLKYGHIFKQKLQLEVKHSHQKELMLEKHAKYVFE